MATGICAMSGCVPGPCHVCRSTRSGNWTRQRFSYLRDGKARRRSRLRRSDRRSRLGLRSLSAFQAGRSVRSTADRDATFEGFILVQSRRSSFQGADLLWRYLSIAANLGQFDIAVIGSVLLHCHSPLQIVEQCAARADTLVIIDMFYPELKEPVCRLASTPENFLWRNLVAA